MNVGCPICGSKAVVSRTINSQTRRKDGKIVIVPITIYICTCGWKGYWHQLKELKKGNKNIN